MSDDYAVLAGELSAWPSKEALAKVFRAAGLQIYEGRYSIRIENCEAFAFEEYGGDIGNPRIAADAKTVEKMTEDARLVSSALIAAGIRHTFEIYDGSNNLATYMHHDWPAEV
jgi:hypothetical protein